MPTANSPMLQVLDRVPDGVLDRIHDGVVDEVSNELTYGVLDCEFSLLHTDQTLDPHNHKIDLNLAQNH
jgi:hypothetical protein